MALTTLDSDLGIIAALPDEPNDAGGLTAAQLKAKFDEAAKTIQTYLNDTHLPQHTAGNIAFSPIEGVSSEDVQAAIAEVYTAGQDVTLGQIPPGTLTFATLDTDVPPKIARASGWGLLQSYTTAGTYTFTVPDAYGDGLAYEIGVYEIGGGGSGGAGRVTNDSQGELRACAAGGASGRTRVFYKTVTPGDTIAVVVGAGGTAKVITTSAYAASGSGNDGGSTSFDGIAALGGEGGQAWALRYDNTSSIPGASGGQGSNAPISSIMSSAPAMGQNTHDLSALYPGGDTFSFEALNPFDMKRYLGAGGAAYAYAYSDSTYEIVETAPALDDGNSGGSGVSHSSNTSDSEDATADSATGNGNGGGGVAVATWADYQTRTATSGAGSDGAVFIYARGI
ncbi:MAG: glycine-rich domain-containing protein [Oscillospiraceae bacterium]